MGNSSELSLVDIIFRVEGDNKYFIYLQTVLLSDALDLQGCHTCRPDPYLDAAMVVHSHARGRHVFAGWYSVIVHGVEKQSAESKSGEEDEPPVVHNFHQEIVHYVVPEHQVIQFFVNENHFLVCVWGDVKTFNSTHFQLRVPLPADVHFVHPEQTEANRKDTNHHDSGTNVREPLL